MTLAVPAASCRPSTFCVIKVKPGRPLHFASTSCARFGRHRAITPRRQSYHSHTSFGLCAKASGVARSSARYCRHKPSSPRNVGTPLAADTPEPVRSEEHTSELQSQSNLVCRLLLEKKKKKQTQLQQ